MAFSMDKIVENIQQLVNADGGINVTGLEFDKIVDNFIDSKYGDSLASIEDDGERNKLKEQWTTFYKSGEGQYEIKMEMETIKSCLAAAKSSLETVQTAATAVPTMSSVPAVLVVGQATGTANPGWVSIQNTVLKNSLLAILKQVEVYLVTALKSMSKISFDIPPEATQQIEMLKTVKQAVNSIP